MNLEKKIKHCIIDGGITPYQLPWIATRFIALKDYLMMMIGRAGGVALLKKAFVTDDYSKEDLQYVADVLRHCSVATVSYLIIVFAVAGLIVLIGKI